MGSAAVSAEHSNNTPRADTLEDVYSMLAAHCTPAYRFKGGVPALGESPAPLVRVFAHIELERKADGRACRHSTTLYRTLPYIAL